MLAQRGCRRAKRRGNDAPAQTPDRRWGSDRAGGGAGPDRRRRWGFTGRERHHLCRRRHQAPTGTESSGRAAYTDLQAALGEVEAGQQIWVAAGTYKPTNSIDRLTSFQMVNSVAIYGGFDPSVGDDAWEDRDWANNVTVLSGDIGIEDDASDNSYHVFYHPDGTGLNDSAILDGFTITGGNANGDWGPTTMAAGCTTPTAPRRRSPTVTFSGNSAIGSGGGMHNTGDSSPTLTNCTFQGNTAGAEGGGMHNDAPRPP